MNLFISSFKPILIAGIIIICAELAVHYFVSYQKQYDSNILVLGPHQKEKITRVFLVEKLKQLSSKKITFAQVGDSSGFYGVRPKNIMEQMGGEEDIAWLNFGCCGKTGFAGYESLFNIVANKQKENSFKHLRYFVLAMTPYYTPKAEFENGDLAKTLHNKTKPIQIEFPTNQFRLAFTNGIYQGEFKNQLLSDRVNTYWGKTLDEMNEDLLNLDREDGWMEHPAKSIDVPEDECNFDFEKESFTRSFLLGGDRSKLKNTLVRLNENLLKRDYTLILLINPVPCQVEGSADAQKFNLIIKQFLDENPNVLAPFEGIRQYPSELFRDKWHLNKKGAIQNSNEIGRALRKKI